MNNEQPTGQTPVPDLQSNVVSSNKKSLTSKQKLFGGIASFVFVTALGFGGYAAWQGLGANAGGENTLGQVETTGQPQGINANVTPSPSNENFSLDVNLSAEPFTATDDSNGGYSSTGGVITGTILNVAENNTTTRVEVTQSPTDETSWKIINGTLDNKYTGTRPVKAELAPENYKLGDTYYFRVSASTDDGATWSVFAQPLKLIIPMATLSTVGEIQSTNVSFKWTVSGSGASTKEEGEDYYRANLPYQYNMYVATKPDMSDRQTAFADNYDVCKQLFIDCMAISYSTTANATLYYGLYDGAYGSNLLLSNIVQVKTAKSTGPVVNIERSKASQFDYKITDWDGYNQTKDGSWITVKAIAELSTKPDAVYSKGKNNSQTGSISSNGGGSWFGSLAPNTSYYLRVRPERSVWPNSGLQWSKIIKITTPAKATPGFTVSLSPVSIKGSKVAQLKFFTPQPRDKDGYIQQGAWSYCGGSAKLYNEKKLVTKLYSTDSYDGITPKSQKTTNIRYGSKNKSVSNNSGQTIYLKAGTYSKLSVKCSGNSDYNAKTYTLPKLTIKK